MDSFPPEFDYEWFAQEYNLQDMEKGEVTRYYHRKGKNNGLCGNRLSHPKEFVDYLTDRFRDCRILEIGPGAAPRFSGSNVKYFDITNSAGLRTWAQKNRINPERVPEEVHHVSPDGDLSIIGDKFDCICSFNNIEHSIDLIKYLNSIAAHLEAGGIFAGSAPDRRYTFDYFRPESTEMDALDQFYGHVGAKRHPLRSFLEYYLMQTHNKAREHWNGNHGQPLNCRENLRSRIDNYISGNNYVDVHRWVFTQDSFRRLMNNLYEMGIIKLKLERIYSIPRYANNFNFIFTAI